MQGINVVNEQDLRLQITLYRYTNITINQHSACLPQVLIIKIPSLTGEVSERWLVFGEFWSQGWDLHSIPTIMLALCAKIGAYGFFLDRENEFWKFIRRRPTLLEEGQFRESQDLEIDRTSVFGRLFFRYVPFLGRKVLRDGRLSISSHIQEVMP